MRSVTKARAIGAAVIAAACVALVSGVTPTAGAVAQGNVTWYNALTNQWLDSNGWTVYSSGSSAYNHWIDYNVGPGNLWQEHSGANTGRCLDRGAWSVRGDGTAAALLMPCSLSTVVEEYPAGGHWQLRTPDNNFALDCSDGPYSNGEYPNDAFFVSANNDGWETWE